jgi:hypothetical protein
LKEKINYYPKILKIGLEYLLQVDKLKVKQLASTVEALTGWDTNNKYEREKVSH